MTRYHLRFDADAMHPVQELEFDRADGAFVFWLAETKDGREFSVTADTKPVCRLRRSCSNRDFWIISKPKDIAEP